MVAQPFFCTEKAQQLCSTYRDICTYNQYVHVFLVREWLAQNLQKSEKIRGDKMSTLEKYQIKYSCLFLVDFMAIQRNHGRSFRPVFHRLFHLEGRSDLRKGTLWDLSRPGWFLRSNGYETSLETIQKALDLLGSSSCERHLQGFGNILGETAVPFQPWLVSVKKRSAVSVKIRCLWHDWT